MQISIIRIVHSIAKFQNRAFNRRIVLRLASPVLKMWVFCRLRRVKFKVLDYRLFLNTLHSMLYCLSRVLDIGLKFMWSLTSRVSSGGVRSHCGSCLTTRRIYAWQRTALRSFRFSCSLRNWLWLINYLGIFHYWWYVVNIFDLTLSTVDGFWWCKLICFHLNFFVTTFFTPRSMFHINT